MSPGGAGGSNRGSRRSRRAGQPGGRRGGQEASEGRPSLHPRGRWLLLGGLVLVAQVAAMALVFLPAPHSGGDNAGYISLGYALLQGGYLELWDPATPLHTKYPPVFPAVLALWIALGAKTWVALKTVPALFSSATVLLVFLWAGKRGTPLFGAGVALLMATSSALLWASHWILSEPLFLALTMLALLAADRADAADPDSAPGGPDRLDGWLLLAIAAGVVASLTRSAGLPLLAAIGGWLLLRKRWRGLAVFAAAAALPNLLWWVRARAAGDVQYVSEFWLVDPYTPALGKIGVGGMIARVWDNGAGYALRWIPEGLVGAPAAGAGLLGFALLGLAAVGWYGRVRDRPGPAELFVPLYAGLILVWPPVWSGDRFALPLLPLLLFYGGEALLAGALRFRRAWAPAVAGAAWLVVFIPSLGTLARSAGEAAECRAVVRLGDPFACYGPGWSQFAAAAQWSGDRLDAGAQVLTRKPRMFFLLSGLSSRTFPFEQDPDVFLEKVSEAGAGYILFDQLDRQALLYVGGAISRRPESFCSVRAFTSQPGQPGTQLFGLVSPESDLGGRIEPGPDGTPTLVLPPCPAERMPDATAGGPGGPAPNLATIPLLER